MAMKPELLEKQLFTSKQETSKDKDKKREAELDSTRLDDLGESLAERIKRAKKEYETYSASQAGIELPVAKISIEESDKDSDTKSDKERVKVYIDTSYQGNGYHFESIREDHAEDIHAYLNSQPLVRAKYGNGSTVSYKATKDRATQLSARFKSDSADGLHLYSGFVVSDEDTGDFLGVCNLGGSGKNDGHAEMAFLNRPDTWSHKAPDVVEEYAIPKKCKLGKVYQGIATVEVFTLLQYSAQLKKKGYQIGGKELEGVNATARLDNPGSWKACAKSGMEVTGVDSNPAYGPELRYQLRRKIS